MNMQLRSLCICAVFTVATANANVEASTPIASGHSTHKVLLNSTRTEVADGVAHYQFMVRVGSGEFDVVRLHRVVRERRPYRPIRTSGQVFMLHGAQLSFEAIYLRAGTDTPSTETSVALYLAAQGIDVWGMDFGWTLVPAGTTDFSFMKNWGIERDADHALDGIAIARVIRWLTGQGFGRMNLLGYSYGVGVTYAAAGNETQKHRRRRHIGGIIPVDALMKYSPADEMSRLNTCAVAADIRATLDSGMYQNESGLLFAALSSFATQAPDGPSPIFAGLTNLQAALFAGTNTFVLSPPPAPFWHFVAGKPDDFGIPTDLVYTESTRWLGLLGSLPPYMPEQARLDLRTSFCDEDEVSIDDHLAEISVPILYIGAGGGFGQTGNFTSSLTSSRDITQFTVSLQPDDRRSVDFGHGELFLGDDAKNLVWTKLLKWLVDHGSRGHHRR
jgi:hypothetical protein